jgi:hypothetical protein
MIAEREVSLGERRTCQRGDYSPREILCATVMPILQIRCGLHISELFDVFCRKYKRAANLMSSIYGHHGVVMTTIC